MIRLTFITQETDEPFFFDDMPTVEKDPGAVYAKHLMLL